MTQRALQSAKHRRTEAALQTSLAEVEATAAQNALLQSNENFRRLADNVTDVFWIRSPDMRTVHYVSPAFERIWGRPAKSLHADPHLWIDFVVPEDRGRVETAFAALTRDAASVDIEYRIARPDGEVRWVRSRGFQVRDSSGALIRLTGVVTDVTEARQAADALRSTNRALKMLSSCREALARTDSEMDLLSTICRVAVEHGGYRMAWVGYARDDASRAITPMAHAGVEEGFLSKIKATWDEHEPLGQGPAGQVIRTGQAVVCQDLARDPQFAPWRAVAQLHGYGGVICLPLGDATRTFGMLALYSADIIETSADELKLLQEVADDLVFGIGNLRARSERERLQAQLMVSDRMASVGTLASGVAHEINNPLAAVIANLDYVLESLERPVGDTSGDASPPRLDPWMQQEIKAPLDEAREAAQRVRFIVRDLKIFSRAPLDEAKGPVDVETIMESALRMAWNEIRHRARVVKLYNHVPAVEANEARLGQVFLNLLVNAAQALPEGRVDRNEIRVTTRVDGERVVVEVSDTGGGIPPEIIGRIFDAFFTTKAVGVGTGLGLAICHRIVTDMGGALTVESQVGKGTTFRLNLPVARSKERSAVVPIGPVTVAGRRGRILVVDDEQLVLHIVMRLLSKEHEVVALASATEALALCASGVTFDLILCDLMMPDMTGMDLHRELSRVAPEQANKMIFLTGGAFTDSARHFLSDVPKEHIEKPFDAANLRAIVRRYLR